MEYDREGDDVIEIPLSVEELYPFTASLALQLFAYYMAEKLERPANRRSVQSFSWPRVESSCMSLA